jgi:hypothetical protein
MTYTRCATILCIAIGALTYSACGQVQTRAAATTTRDGRAYGSNAVIPEKPPSGTSGARPKCIIKPKDTFVILDVQPDDEHGQAPYPTPLAWDIARRATDALHNEASAASLPVSEYHQYPVFEQWNAGCEASPTGDGVCIATIAAHLDTDWILWGYIKQRSEQRYEGEFQLVSRVDPTARRNIVVNLNNNDQLVSVIHSVWQRLVQP